MGSEDLVVYRAMDRKERVLCSTLCICIFFCIMSAVSMVYLSVIIYVPAQRELDLGLASTSVMCTTTETRRIKGDIEACKWASCSEWCLSKGGGDCTHLYVQVRANGTDLRLNNCLDVERKVCDVLDEATAEKFNCKEDHACTRLHKMHSCRGGVCVNITSAYSCSYDAEADAEAPVSCLKKRNCVELDGMFDCWHGRCRRITHWTCERRCADLDTTGKNVILRAGDAFLLAKCKSANDVRSGSVIWSESDYSSDDDSVLMASCTSISSVGVTMGVTASDCINGTLISRGLMGDVTNYTRITSVFVAEGDKRRLDPSGTFVPFEQQLVIFNNSRLMINTEGCVNSLQGECAAFYRALNKDGRNQTSPARFPCFYAPHNPNFVVKNFDLTTTKWLFFVFFCVPAGMLLFSCGFLFACTRLLSIDSSGHMVIGCCGSSIASDDEDKAEVMQNITINVEMEE